MRPGIATSALAIAATAIPVICSAGASAPPDRTALEKAAPTRTAVRPLSLMDLSPTKPLLRPYQAVGVEPREDQLPTSVSYQPFASGPVGSVGVICRPLSHALNASPVGATADGQAGSQSQTVGANFAYVFR